MKQKYNDLDVRKQQELTETLQEADYVLKKHYQYDLEQCEILYPGEELLECDIVKQMRLFKIKRIVYDKNEDNISRLLNVYNAMSAVSGSVILLIDSDGENFDFYIGTKTERAQDIHVAFKTLEKALHGNFPGCEIENLRKLKLEKRIRRIFEYRDDSSIEENRTISSVNGISSIRELAANKEKKEFTQGIEKMIDAMRGESFSVLLIADPVSQKQIEVIRNGYEQMYTKLVPFANMEVQLGVTSGNTITDSITKGFSDTISESLTLSQSYSHTSTISKTEGSGVGVSVGTNSPIGVSASVNTSKFSSTTESESTTSTQGTSETKGTSKTKSFSSGVSNAISKSESRSLQIRTEEKAITSLIEQIDIQLERLSECGDLGMWNSAAYFIADDLQISKTAASTYQALIRGENSSIEAITVNTWSRYGDEKAIQNYDALSLYLRKLHHPNIAIGNNLPVVTPTSLISSAELAIQAGLPQKSIPGLAVAQYVPFGRDVQSIGKERGSVINLGSVYHMGQNEDRGVFLNTKSLASHTFITGSTGTGKSNTVYQLLGELQKKNVGFLIIEPAKGEYKHMFGMQGDVQVYGTNPYYTPLLKINPFKFPKGIHVLEHVDRLVEIFNVCWPMYAAMPAVLKDSILRAYESCGWNMITSKNKEGEFYPTFEDVLRELDIVINTSAYSADTKGDYIGSLSTRLRSLTNGLNGQIFVNNEVDNENLFDGKTIVDLSRVGSMETKALLMGILVMRLSEHRMSEEVGMNQPLKHVTVLEEAHNILKRTSTEQNMEGANMMGKSVEMISNAIAEMRTYGEGFVIADQSPNAVDISAIRNTNTKIIMRLPDEDDRQLAGRAAALKEEQLPEIAKLPKGVAVVYQNDWLEPVLCQINKYSGEEQRYQYEPEDIAGDNEQDKWFKSELLKLLVKGRINEPIDVDIDKMQECITDVSMSSKDKLFVQKLVREFKETGELEIWDDSRFEELAVYITELLGCKAQVEKFLDLVPNIDLLPKKLDEFVEKHYEGTSLAVRLTYEQCLLLNHILDKPEHYAIYDFWRKTAIKEVR